MVEEDKYSMEEIREACKEVFHDTGELWFGGHKDDWQEAYLEIQDALLKLKGKPIV